VPDHRHLAQRGDHEEPFRLVREIDFRVPEIDFLLQKRKLHPLRKGAELGREELDVRHPLSP
jgi:hypothetical protein